MSNGSSGDFGEPVSRSRNWDHPNGLGWEVWRRVQSMGLLRQPIQRDLSRFHASILRDPAPLASDIRRRWGVGGNPSIGRFALDLPLFLGYFPFFRARPLRHLSASGPETARPFADISRVVSEKSRWEVATTFPGLPSSAADSQETAQTMVPPSVNRRGHTTAVDTAARDAQSSKQEQSEQKDSRFALRTTLVRQEGLLPQRITATVGTLSLKPRPSLLSTDIIERHQSMLGLQRKPNVESSESEDQFATDPVRPMHGISAILNRTVGGESDPPTNRPLLGRVTQARSVTRIDTEAETIAAKPGTTAQDSLMAAALPMDYSAGGVSRADAQPIDRIGGTKERVRPDLFERSGVSQSGLRPGGMTGMILLTQRLISPIARMVPLSSVPQQQLEHVPAPGLYPAARTERGIDAGVGSPSSGLDTSVNPKTTDSQQTGTNPTTTRVVKIQSDATRVNVASRTGLGLTSPAPPQITATFSRQFATGTNERLELPTLRNERAISNFGGAYAAPVFTARRTVIGLRPTAMPISIAPIFKRHESVASSVQSPLIPEVSVGFASTASRAEYQGSSRIDNSIRGDETGAGISFSFGDGSRVLRPHEASDSNRMLGQSLSHAAIARKNTFGDSIKNSGHSAPDQSRARPIAATDLYDRPSIEVSLSRGTPAGVSFGTVSDSGAIVRQEGWLPIAEAGLPLMGLAVAQSSIQRVFGRFAAPLLIARTALTSMALGNQLPRRTEAPEISQSTEIVRAGWSRSRNAGEPAEITPRSPELVTSIAPLWSTTITAPAVLHRSAASPNQEPYTLAPANGGAFHDLPLVAQSMIAKEINLTAAHRNNGTSMIRTAPQDSVRAVTGGVPFGAEGGSLAVEKSTAAAQPQIDLDELVEKAWQKLMRKLTIEQERRGGMT
jgi:hypothetical protein